MVHNYLSMLGLAYAMLLAPASVDNISDTDSALVDAFVEPMWYEDLSFNAFLSTSVVHNFAARTVQPNINYLRLFDASNDALKIDAVQLVFQMAPIDNGDAGFRIDLMHGSVLPFSTHQGIDDLFLQQAFIAYIAPIGNGLRMDLGRFVLNIGTETLEGYENVNDNYSHGLLFAWGLPKIANGLRLSYDVSTNVALTLFGINSFEPLALDNNVGKSFGAQTTVSALENLLLSLSYIMGPEKNNDSSNLRHVVDVVTQWMLQPVTLTLELLYGTESNLSLPTTKFGGAALFARWDISRAWLFGARADYFDNRDGVRIGPQHIKGRYASLTLTPSYKFADSTLLRLEWRLDKAMDAQQPFVANIAPSDMQHTLAVNVLFVF